MTENENEKMIETEGMMKRKQAKTSDDLITELMRRRTWKYTVFIMCLMVVWTGGPPAVYLTSFAGLLL